MGSGPVTQCPNDAMNRSCWKVAALGEMTWKYGCEHDSRELTELGMGRTSVRREDGLSVNGETGLRVTSVHPRHP